MLSPARTPTISNLPIANTTSYNHSKMISLYARCTAVEDPPIVTSPVPWIYWYNYWPKLKLFCEFSTGHDFTIVFEFIWLRNGFSLTLKRSCIVDWAHIVIIVIGRDAVFFKMIIYIFWLFASYTIRAAIYYLLFRESDEILFKIIGKFVLSILQYYLLIYFEFHHCCDCKYMWCIEIAHILHGGHILAPIIVIVILKLSNFQIFLWLCKGGDSMIQLLKLRFTNIRKAPNFIIELLI